MHEVMSYHQSRDWFKFLAITLFCLGALCTFLYEDFFWMASGFAIFGGWWFTVSETKNRIPQIALSVAMGMMIACILDAISFSEPFNKRGFQNFIPLKVALYTIAAFAGVLLGLGSSNRK